MHKRWFWYTGPFETENYVKNVQNRKVRSVIAKTRCDTLPIAIEIGRYRNIKKQDRLCVYCDKQEVEDRSHILFTCALYEDLRSQFLKNVELKCNEPNEMLVELLGKSDYLKQTGIYVSNILSKRAGAVWI